MTNSFALERTAYEQSRNTLDYTIVVAGLARCGTSLTMQMLAAGGVPCTGVAPAYEDPATSTRVTPEYIAENAGRAIKVLDPQRTGLPGDVRVIWLDRDTKEQAASQIKFLRLITGLSLGGRVEHRSLEHSLIADRRKAMRLIGRRPLLMLEFESILRDPMLCAQRISEFIGTRDFNPHSAARVVRQRSHKCAPSLDMELTLIAEAGGDALD